MEELSMLDARDRLRWKSTFGWEEYTYFAQQVYCLCILQSVENLIATLWVFINCSGGEVSPMWSSCQMKKWVLIFKFVADKAKEDTIHSLKNFGNTCYVPGNLVPRENKRGLPPSQGTLCSPQVVVIWGKVRCLTVTRSRLLHTKITHSFGSKLIFLKAW